MTVADDLRAARETAWLIESGAQTYWAGRAPDDFTSDLSDAVRFARQRDAERVRCWLIDSHNKALAMAVRASEHVWLIANEDTTNGRG